MKKRNEIIFKNDRVIKKFSNFTNYKKELSGNFYFSNSFYVPKIYALDSINMSIYMERIIGKDFFIFYNFDIVKEIFLRLDKQEFVNEKFIIKNIGSIDDKVLFKGFNDEEINNFNSRLDFSDKKLITGDLRPYNIFLKNNEICLIDFEFSKNSVIEEDVAKLYTEFLSINKKMSTFIFNYAKKNYNYFNFLYFCLATGYKQLQSGFYDENNVLKYISEVRDEILRNV